VGAIGERMFGGTSAYYRGLAALVSTGRIEFFNHGWNHAINATREDGSVYCEFRDTPYEYQHAHFLATQRLLRKEAGIVLRGFGAPGNAHDEVTRRVIDEAGDTAYWFFAAGPSQKTILRRVADIEDKRNLPDYDTFVATYKPGAEYIVYQLHPWFWDETLLAEFVRCVDDLIAMGVTFVLPGEYVAMVNAARTPGD
jgi:peptidoglycan/xylan/chitin deacetylase (PgdA/CDA1 family)